MMGGCAQMMGSGLLMDLDDVGCATFGDDESDCEGFAAPPTFSKGFAKKRGVGGAPRRGVANAARVSRGSEFDVWSGLTVREPERHRGRPPPRPDLRLHEGGADREGRRRHHHESEDAAVRAAAGGGDGRVDLPGRRRVTCAPCTAYTGLG